MERKELNLEIGKRVRGIRESLGFSREQAAELANISTQFLSDIEMGRKSMTTYTLINLTKTLGVSSDYLLFGENSSISNSPVNLCSLIDNLSVPEKKLAENVLKTILRGIAIDK